MPHTPEKQSKNGLSVKKIPTCDVCGQTITPYEPYQESLIINGHEYNYTIHEKCADITRKYLLNFRDSLRNVGISEPEINAFIRCYLKGIMKKKGIKWPEKRKKKL